jgi:hypothetical protein
MSGSRRSPRPIDRSHSPALMPRYGARKANGSRARNRRFVPPRSRALIGEGSGVLAPNPSFLEHQPACKPGFVGHRRLAQAVRDGHSSGTMFAHCLEQPTRTASLTTPCGVIALRRTFPRCRPYSVLLPVWFAMPFPLPDPRCALTAPFHPYCAKAPKGKGERFVLCGTVPGVAPAGRYPAPFVDGARTFLPSHLSVIAGAAVRPTDALGHEGWGRPRQADYLGGGGQNKLS